MKSPIPKIPLHERPWLTVLEACAVAGMGRTTLYKAIAAGRLVAHKRGRRTIIQRKDLDAFLESFPMKPGRETVVAKSEQRENRLFPWDFVKD